MGRTFLYIFFLLHGGSASYLAIIISCRLYFLLLSPVNNTPSSSSSPGMHGALNKLCYVVGSCRQILFETHQYPRGIHGTGLLAPHPRMPQPDDIRSTLFS
jgi:hypothetical protein